MGTGTTVLSSSSENPQARTELLVIQFLRAIPVPELRELLEN
jgi:hypothetical protein